MYLLCFEWVNWRWREKNFEKMILLWLPLWIKMIIEQGWGQNRSEKLELEGLLFMDEMNEKKWVCRFVIDGGLENEKEEWIDLIEKFDKTWTNHWIWEQFYSIFLCDGCYISLEEKRERVLVNIFSPKKRVPSKARKKTIESSSYVQNEPKIPVYQIIDSLSFFEEEEIKLLQSLGKEIWLNHIYHFRSNLPQLFVKINQVDIKMDQSTHILWIYQQLEIYFGVRIDFEMVEMMQINDHIYFTIQCLNLSIVDLLETRIFEKANEKTNFYIFHKKNSSEKHNFLVDWNFFKNPEATKYSDQFYTKENQSLFNQSKQWMNDLNFQRNILPNPYLYMKSKKLQSIPLSISLSNSINYFQISTNNKFIENLSIEDQSMKDQSMEELFLNIKLFSELVENPLDSFQYFKLIYNHIFKEFHLTSYFSSSNDLWIQMNKSITMTKNPNIHYFMANLFHYIKALTWYNLQSHIEKENKVQIVYSTIPFVSISLPIDSLNNNFNNLFLMDLIPAFQSDKTNKYGDLFDFPLYYIQVKSQRKNKIYIPQKIKSHFLCGAFISYPLDPLTKSWIHPFRLSYTKIIFLAYELEKNQFFLIDSLLEKKPLPNTDFAIWLIQNYAIGLIYVRSNSIFSHSPYHPYNHSTQYDFTNLKKLESMEDSNIIDLFTPFLPTPWIEYPYQLKVFSWPETIEFGDIQQNCFRLKKKSEIQKLFQSPHYAAGLLIRVKGKVLVLRAKEGYFNWMGGRSEKIDFTAPQNLFPWQETIDRELKEEIGYSFISLIQPFLLKNGSIFFRNTSLGLVIIYSFELPCLEFLSHKKFLLQSSEIDTAYQSTLYPELPPGFECIPSELFDVIIYDRPKDPLQKQIASDILRKPRQTTILKQSIHYIFSC